ncbi:MAG: hypothetical protein J7L16_09905 [Deltaproteobacteria bacterium]|nr:hypothetical protein [Deltaproteobacteria bacterium]
MPKFGNKYIGAPPGGAVRLLCGVGVIYDIISVVKAALSSEYGAETVENEVSEYYIIG